MTVPQADGSKRPDGSVVIIGAGTQGRRLAFMVREYFDMFGFSRIPS